MGDIKPWPKPTGRPDKLPRPAKRPCDYQLYGVVTSLETQLGTIEAYNRLCFAAKRLFKKIEAGDAKAQNPLFAIEIRGATSLKPKSKFARQPHAPSDVPEKPERD